MFPKFLIKNKSKTSSMEILTNERIYSSIHKYGQYFSYIHQRGAKLLL